MNSCAFPCEAARIRSIWQWPLPSCSMLSGERKAMQDLRLQPAVLVADDWKDFELLDSGDGRKLERYGPYRFIRPEPQALWRPSLPDWQADGEFVPGSDEEGGGRWYLENGKLPQHWSLTWDEVRFQASCTPF